VDDETRAAFEQMREEMRRGFAAAERGFDAVDRRFDAVDQRFDAVDRRFDVADQRFDGVDQRIETVRREAGVISEDLRSRLQLVAEIVDGNAKAIERLRTDMAAKFRQNELLLRAAFRHIRRR
jgi:hypothetical protein